MTETRTTKVKRNVFTSIILQMIKIVLNFVGRIVFVRILGASYLGVNGLFMNVLTILSVADLGMNTAMMYSLYKPLANGDKVKVATYVDMFKKIYNTIAVVIGILGILTTPFLKYIINLPENMDGIYTFYLLMLANTVIGYLFIYRTTLLQADQKSYLLDIVDMVTQILLFVAQITILIATRNFAFYLCANVLTTLISNIIKSRIVSRQYKYLSNPAPKLSHEEKNKLIKNVKDVFFYRIGGVIQSNTDNILTSIFVGTIMVGYYSNYMLVILAITSFVTVVFTALKSSVGNFNSEAPLKEQEKMFYNFEDYNYVLIAFCSICFYVLFPDFITICFGKDYLLETVAVVFIVLNFYTSNIRQNLWVYRETTGLFAKVKFVTLVTAIINLFLSILGGYLFGIVGIVGATVIGRMLYAWWKEPTVIFRDYFKTSPKRYFMDYIVKLIYVIVVAYVLSIVTKLIVIDNEIVQSFVRAAFVVIVAAIMVYLPLRKKESMKILRSELRIKK